MVVTIYISIFSTALNVLINVLLKPFVKKERDVFTKILYHSWYASGRQLFLDSWLDI